MRTAQARSAEVSDSLAKRFSRGIDGDRMRSEVLRVCVILRSRKIRTARSFELPICPEGGQLVFAELGRHWQTRLVQSLADLLPQARAGVRSEKHTSELQSQSNLVCRILPETKQHVLQMGK